MAAHEETGTGGPKSVPSPSGAARQGRPEARCLVQALAAWLADPSSLAASLPDWPDVLRGFFSRCLALEADSRAQATAAM